MKRPYISGPMSGIKHHNFPAFFEAASTLRELGYTPLNPASAALASSVYYDNWKDAYQASLNNPQAWETYIRRDTQMVLDADSIVLLPGWDKSKGACLEVVISVCVGNSVHFFDGTDISSASKGDVYADAMNHLNACGLGGVVPDLCVVP